MILYYDDLAPRLTEILLAYHGFFNTFLPPLHQWAQAGPHGSTATVKQRLHFLHFNPLTCPALPVGGSYDDLAARNKFSPTTHTSNARMGLGCWCWGVGGAY